MDHFTVAPRRFKRISEDEKPQIVAERRAGVRTAEIAIRHGVSQVSINKLLRKLGEPLTPREQYRKGRPRGLLPAEAIIAKHDAGWTLEALAQEYDCTVLTVKRLLLDHDRPMRVRRQYTVNHDFFQAPLTTEAQVYLAGFLGADGSTSKTGYSMKVSLKREDEGHVVKVRDAIGSNAPIIQEEKVQPNGVVTPMSTVIICSKKLNGDLCSLGIIPAKSFVARPLAGLSPEFLRHHLRGWFDGDGTISRYQSGTWEVSIVGSIDTVSAFARFVEQLTGFRRTPRPHKSIYRVRYQHMAITRKIVAELYGGATIFLDRKRTLADGLLARKPKHGGWYKVHPTPPPAPRASSV